MGQAIFTDDFDVVVENYHNTQKELVTSLYVLAERIYNAFPKKYTLDKDELLQEMVMISIEKLPRFKFGKGRPINFFTTVMLGMLRQFVAHDLKGVKNG